ncbi:MAG: hypothetical protein F4110_01600 [Acidimicrobiaceae bacterium]|nr:hypothetical protein [Acidimicrobiaceae bacterium]MYE97296.1 hypothetical protein [Acidimicrobiaceae bacterium]MYH44754.1 hypothetical protein [Acidimicrobiaceae bacterium]MYI52680.1 hypothetical protein [Acidimicrobiaceae bacterium]MYJ82220.1 hypothetical protein [Acidimicrobiaceae bacterium]
MHQEDDPLGRIVGDDVIAGADRSRGHQHRPGRFLGGGDRHAEVDLVEADGRHRGLVAETRRAEPARVLRRHRRDRGGGGRDRGGDGGSRGGRRGGCVRSVRGVGHIRGIGGVRGRRSLLALFGVINGGLLV